MKNNIRFALLAVFVIAVLVLAQNGSVWANPRADAAPAGQSNGFSAPAADEGKGGTVKPPHNHIYITKPGTYSLGGCLIHVVNLTPGITLSVEYVPRFHNEHKLDNDHPKFRAGTCRITYFKDGKKIDGIQDPEQGTVYACFGATRNPKGIVHVYTKETKTWHNQPTTYDVYNPKTGQWRPAQGNEPALTCGQANLTGYYLVASAPK